ncbi:hypothetical protein M427DRAFT_156176 [Gonapodya prolifera JEL478]|uniref:Uncharacterized protein n=1 Tax=Gonapodya prolifera (strain JEL478) TaxID=1344416 RepID=A0A139ACL1_GONPJ|nr:hypothetical protein M427DRAFT_156176 [Gonapodya prolifera JEL478]|eukprot:KXS14185.1 hypothetical protein M427DRAFT_156176 [Gonapodya prolifera JEL478]
MANTLNVTQLHIEDYYIRGESLEKFFEDEAQSTKSLRTQKIIFRDVPMSLLYSFPNVQIYESKYLDKFTFCTSDGRGRIHERVETLIFSGDFGSIEPKTIDGLSRAISDGAFPRLRNLEFSYELDMDPDPVDEEEWRMCDAGMDRAVSSVLALKRLLDTFPHISATMEIQPDDYRMHPKMFNFIHIENDPASCNRRLKAVEATMKYRTALEFLLGGGCRVMSW